MMGQFTGNVSEADLIKIIVSIQIYNYIDQPDNCTIT